MTLQDLENILPFTQQINLRIENKNVEIPCLDFLEKKEGGFTKAIKSRKTLLREFKNYEVKNIFATYDYNKAAAELIVDLERAVSV